MSEKIQILSCRVDGDRPMIHPDKLTESQIREILNDFVTILAFHEGVSLKEEHEMAADDPRMVRWRETAESLWSAVKEAIA